MEINAETMEIGECSNPLGDSDLFRNHVEQLELQKSQLLTQIDGKNNKIGELDQKNFQLAKENGLLKFDLSSLSEQNNSYQDEIKRLTDLLATYEQKDDDKLIQENRKSLHSSLINDLNLTIVELQKNQRENLVGNIEHLAKLNQSSSDLAVLKENNELLQKFIKSKDEYISLLSEYVQNSKGKFSSIESSFQEEMKMQNETISTYQKENAELRMQNKLFETNLTSTKSTVANLSEKLAKLQEELNQVNNDRNKCINEFAIEKNLYVSEIENLNDLLKRSKDEIVEQYIEKFYPNITGLCKMFDKNVTISQLYSLYLEGKRNNEDLKIENSVFSERVSLLECELEVLQETSQKYFEEIQIMRNLEGEIFHLENDKKELSIALKFYQDASQNFYKGSKSFNENFIALSEKIQMLAQQTNESNADSTGTLALDYIMQLQSKFQDFSKLQTEFEKGKLDFINEKNNLIETDHEIGSLRSQVELLESEKRIYTNKYELLSNEYEMMQTLMQNSKLNYETENEVLRNENKNLKGKFDLLTKEVQTLKVNLEDLQKLNAATEGLKNDREINLQNRIKEIDFINQRLSAQQNISSQLEKSLEQLRKQNANLSMVNQKLMNNLNAIHDSQSQANSKYINLESQLFDYKLKVNILTEKESMLIQKLNTTQNENIKQEGLTNLIDSLKQSSSSIEGNLLKNIRLMENEKDSFANLIEENEKNWRQEKSILTTRIAELETFIQDELIKYNSLNENYIKLQEIKSVTLDENATVDEVVKSENILLKSQLENVNMQFQELSTQLNSFKQNCLELNLENTRLLNINSELQTKSSVLKNDNATLSARLNQMQSELQNKLTQLESKFIYASEKHSMLLVQLNTELDEKETCCQLYLSQIESLNNNLSDLNCKLEQSSINSNSLEEQIKLYSENNTHLQAKYDQELNKHSHDAQTIVDLRKRIDQLQNRINEGEQERVSCGMKLNDQLGGSKSDYKKLQYEYKQLSDLFVSVQQQNVLLCNQLKDLQLQMCQDSTSVFKQENLIEFVNMNGVIDNLTEEIRLYQDRCDSFAIKEARLKNEIDNLRSAQLLEGRLVKESENMTNLKSIYNQNADQRFDSMSEAVQTLRAEKGKLKRECYLQKQVIENLERQINSEDVQNLNKTLSDNKLQIEMLNSQVIADRKETTELSQKLKVEQDRNAKFEKDIRELTSKIDSQSSNLDFLKKELESKNNLNQNSKTEINNLKSSLALSDETKANLSNEIESLRQNIELLQTTNQKLRMVARKYKAQYDELQGAGSKESNDSNQSKENQNSSDSLAEKENKIKELEEQIKTQLSEFEKSREEINRLSRENEKLREKEHNNQIATERTNQELNNKTKLIATQQSKLAALRAELGQNTTSTFNQPSTSNGNSNKISSTYISASLPSTSFYSVISSNLQPSSSNEDNVSLQSAQITSHSTSVDDNNSQPFSMVASQVADSNVSSNKRGYSSDSASSQKKARRGDSDSIQFEEENSNQSIEIIEEDSNDVSATDSAPINYAENNDESVENEFLEGVNEDPNPNVSSNMQFDDQSDAASSSQLPSRPSSISFYVPTTSSMLINPLLMQPGPSSRHHITTSSGVIMASHPLSSHSLNAPFEPDRTSHMVPSNNAPRLIIPPNNMLSPPNPLMTPLVPFSVEEGEGIVPSTPILYAPRYEESIISPQVPQSRFVFSTGGASASGTSVTPTISDTVSSVITINDAVAEYESNTFRREHVETNQEEEQVSSLPTSSDSSSLQVSQPEDVSQGQQPTSGILSRPRKLRIRGSSRGRP